MTRTITYMYTNSYILPEKYTNIFTLVHCRESDIYYPVLVSTAARGDSDDILVLVQVSVSSK
jgi:hypothetical protein